MSNMFDPSKLDLDLDNLDKKEEEVNPLQNMSVKVDEEHAFADKKKDRKEAIDPLASLDKGEETSVDITKGQAVVKVEEEKPEEFYQMVFNDNEENERRDIIDQSINSLDDLLDLCMKGKFAYFTATPDSDYVRVDFKVGEKVEDTKLIPYRVYSKVLIKAKTIGKLDIEVDNSEQKGEGKLERGSAGIKVFVKTSPNEFGEKLYFKPKELPKVKKTQKSGMSGGQILTFLISIIVIVLILLGAFISFIVLNAQTPQDVEIFRQLGINVGEINRFIKSTVIFIFASLIFIQTIFFSVFTFKALLTKKIYKRKKTVASLLSGFMLILVLGTSSLGMTLYKKDLPNWASLARGSIQVFDNTRYVSPDFDKDESILGSMDNVIGPITIRYDLSNFIEEKKRDGFYVNKFIWDFGDGTQVVETLNPVIIHTFKEEGLFEISLEVTGTDKGEVTSMEVNGIEALNITSVVDYEEEMLPNGSKRVSFDASSLANEGTIKWYLDSMEKGVEMYSFKPGQAFFEDTYVGMKIIVNGEEQKYFDKIFLIKGADSTGIGGEIEYEKSKNDDLVYSLKVIEPFVQEGNGFVDAYEWIIGDEIINIDDVDVTSEKTIEESSIIEHTFESYGEQEILVRVYDSSGNFNTLRTVIDIPKTLELSKRLEITVDGSLVESKGVVEDNRYNIGDLEVPAEIKLDARRVKAENALYGLKQVYWDFNKDGKYDKVGKLINERLIDAGIHEIGVEYVFIHKVDETDVVRIKEFIDFEAIEREVALDLIIKPKTLYAPTTVEFDASASNIKGQDIVKFIFDYDDGSAPEERDAINKGHKYLESGIYNIKVIAVTDKGNSYSLSKKLVLKKQAEKVNITSSMKTAPVYQEIDFSSAGSVGEITRFLWDFGDGQKSREANPTHFYEAPGKYTVTLDVDFASNNSLIETYEIEVTK